MLPNSSLGSSLSQVREAQETPSLPLQLHLSRGPKCAPGGPTLVTGFLVTRSQRSGPDHK